MQTNFFSICTYIYASLNLNELMQPDFAWKASPQQTQCDGLTIVQQHPLDQGG